MRAVSVAKDYLLGALLVLLICFAVRQESWLPLVSNREGYMKGNGTFINWTFINEPQSFKHSMAGNLSAGGSSTQLWPCLLQGPGQSSARITQNSRYQKSLEESHGFLRYSEKQWERKKKIHRWQSGRQRGKQTTTGPTFYQNNWEPTWSCGYEQRIGNLGDGGKWVCDAYLIAEAPACNILSIGSDNDWSFEEAMHNLNPRCKIHTFDHTIMGRVKNKPDYVNYYPMGLGPQSAGPIGTMDVLLQAAGLSNTSVDILKIDCEGCEYMVYNEFFKGFIRQIMIELHGISCPNNYPGTSSCRNKAGPLHVNQFFESMDLNGYVIFHKEPNTLGSGGDCIEYAFVKLNLPR